MKEMLRFSKWGHNLYNREKNVGCLYNALTMKTIYYPGELFGVLEELRTQGNSIVSKITPKLHNLIEKAKQEKIIVDYHYNEFEILEKIVKKLFKGPNIRTLILLVTDFCNLNCKYCYIEKSLPKSYKHHHMSKKTAEVAVKKFFSIASKTAKAWTIVFYGGEPLLNWDVVKHSLKFLDNLHQDLYPSKKLQKVLITNGVLMDREKAETLAKHHVHVALSIDGPQDIHDKNRVFPSGKGSFEPVMRAFYILKEANILPSISAVMTKEAIPSIEKVIKFFVEEMGVKRIGFNHVSIVPNVNEYDPEYERQFGKAIINIHNIILQRGDVYERRASNKIYNFFKRHIQRADCTGCGEQISVSPDGSIGVCQGFIGSRYTFKASVFNEDYDPHYDPIFIEWSNRSPLNMKQCYNCIALAICGGGCPKNAYMLNGSIWERDTAYCHFAKLLCEWLIWKKYDMLYGGRKAS